jgi:hypothetical protein
VPIVENKSSSTVAAIQVVAKPKAIERRDRLEDAAVQIADWGPRDK